MSAESQILTYVSPHDPWWKRWAMHAVEDLSGRRRLLPIYRAWRTEVAGKSPLMMNELLGMIGTTLEINSGAPDAGRWPVAVPREMPLVIVANHPFGIGDGIAILALAEQLGRPCRILAHSDLLKVPEIRHLALPIDFSGSRDAIKTNVESRNAARRLLREGVTIVVFPAGGVATADDPAGKAEELPWKTFTARLIQQAQAAVLPVYFEGQNSLLFHFVSRYSVTMRLALLVSELRNFVGATVRVHVGAMVPFAELASRADRQALTAELYARVHQLAPGSRHLPLDQLRQRPPHERRRYPWDPPLEPAANAEA
ncbi:MAG TPA: lysophospholipid acyltransferase family protein [Xanthobacteraceae bacterium]|jgi:putative hemolysin|nr:lysophospholipid acyltransferase family protein [Xanthobacteraceae bacterium]